MNALSDTVAQYPYLPYVVVGAGTLVVTILLLKNRIKEILFRWSHREHSVRVVFLPPPYFEEKKSDVDNAERKAE